MFIDFNTSPSTKIPNAYVMSCVTIPYSENVVKKTNFRTLLNMSRQTIDECKWEKCTRRNARPGIFLRMRTEMAIRYGLFCLNQFFFVSRDQGPQWILFMNMNRVGMVDVMKLWKNALRFKCFLAFTLLFSILFILRQLRLLQKSINPVSFFAYFWTPPSFLNKLFQNRIIRKSYYCHSSPSTTPPHLQTGLYLSLM